MLVSKLQNDDINAANTTPNKGIEQGEKSSFCYKIIQISNVLVKYTHNHNVFNHNEGSERKSISNFILNISQQ